VKKSGNEDVPKPNPFTENEIHKPTGIGILEKIPSKQLQQQAASTLARQQSA